MDQFGDNLYNTLRLDRGGLRLDRRPQPTCARRPARPAGRRTPPSSRSSTRRTGSCPTASPAGSSSATSMLFEGYTGGGHKEIDRRADVVGRRGPVRRRRSALRRGPRRRDDRLRRRERLPRGDRGLPGPPRRASSRWPRSASTTTTTASGCGRSWSSSATATGAPAEDELKRLGEGRTWPATRCRARSCSSTSCPATRPARSSSASWPSVDADGTRRHDRHLDSAGRPPTSRCATSSARTSRCRRTAGARRCCWSSTRTPSPACAPARWRRSASRLDEFMTFDTEVLAISCDPTYALRAFADADGLNFPLLSDFWPHGEVTQRLRRLRRRQGAAAAVVVRRGQAGPGPLGGAQPDARRAATSTSTSASSIWWRTRWPEGRVPHPRLDRL